MSLPPLRLLLLLDQRPCKAQQLRRGMLRRLRQRLEFLFCCREWLEVFEKAALLPVLLFLFLLARHWTALKH